MLKGQRVIITEPQTLNPGWEQVSQHVGTLGTVVDPDAFRGIGPEIIALVILDNGYRALFSQNEMADAS